jgi:hypothetical protein
MKVACFVSLFVQANGPVPLFLREADLGATCGQQTDRNRRAESKKLPDVRSRRDRRRGDRRPGVFFISESMAVVDEAVVRVTRL